MESKPLDANPICKPLSEQVLDFSNPEDLMLVHGRYYELSAEQ